MPSSGYFAHESSYIDDGAVTGNGTKIWHFSHVMPGAVIGERCNLGQNVVVMPGTRIGNNVKIQNNVSIYEGIELEDVVFEFDPFIDGDVVLNLDVVADPGSRHDDDVLAEIAPFADHRARHHVGEVPDLGAVPGHRSVIDVAGFVREVAGRGHLDPDDLALELQRHARLLRHSLADVVDHFENVTCRRGSFIDDVVRVLRGHLRAADGEAFETALIDQHSRGLGPARIDERGSAAWLIEGGARFPPAEQLGLKLLEFGR